MRIALTGTPGTGKTSVAEALKGRGYDVIDLTRHIKDNGLREEYDAERDTYAVDVEKLNESLSYREDCVFEGHLAHFIDVDLIVVLRCHPVVLAERLRARGYDEGKVRENVEAELLDVILCESADTELPVYVIDTTSDTPEQSSAVFEKIVRGETEGHLPDDISWADEMDKWFD